MKTYKTFLRMAKNFEEFSRANNKLEIELNLTEAEAKERCKVYNSNRSQAEIEYGVKMEFESE